MQSKEEIIEIIPRILRRVPYSRGLAGTDYIWRQLCEKYPVFQYHTDMLQVWKLTNLTQPQVLEIAVAVSNVQKEYEELMNNGGGNRRSIKSSYQEIKRIYAQFHPSQEVPMSEEVAAIMETKDLDKLLYEMPIEQLEEVSRLLFAYEKELAPYLKEAAQLFLQQEEIENQKKREQHRQQHLARQRAQKSAAIHRAIERSRTTRIQTNLRETLEATESNQRHTKKVVTGSRSGGTTAKRLICPSCGSPISTDYSAPSCRCN